jgi:hypothetical protein
MELKKHLEIKMNKIYRISKKKNFIYKPPPFFAAKYGKRQTLPRPTEFEIKENTNSIGRSHS